MKSLLAFGAIVAALTQLASYLLTKSKFDQLEKSKGVIVVSKLDDYSDIDGRVYKANIKYRFNFNGADYESENVALRAFELFPLFNYEHQLVQKYSQDQSILVHHKINKPEESFLEIAPLNKLSVTALFVAATVAIIYLVLVALGYQSIA